MAVRYVNLGGGQYQPQQEQFANSTSSNRPLNIIVATDAMGGFGARGKIPWDIPEDRTHFKEITDGHIVVMGRKTYDDIAKHYAGKEFLPNRESYVISRGEPELMDGVTLCSSLRDFLNKTMDTFGNKQTFVIGGEKLFIQALPWSTKVYVTLVHGKYDCDKFFPINNLKEAFTQTKTDVVEDRKYAFVEFMRK